MAGLIVNEHDFQMRLNNIICMLDGMQELDATMEEIDDNIDTIRLIVRRLRGETSALHDLMEEIDRYILAISASNKCGISVTAVDHEKLNFELGLNEDS